MHKRLLLWLTSSKTLTVKNKFNIRGGVTPIPTQIQKIMTNIKIVRRFARGQYEEGTEPEVYDIYFDVGLFSPLIKKWMIDKSALTREEAIKYITPWLLDTAHNKIYVTTE